MPLYRTAEIPSKALEGATEWITLADDEPLILLYDRTVFGSASTGIAFTDRRVINYDKGRRDELLYRDLGFVGVEENHDKSTKVHFIKRDGAVNVIKIHTLDPAALTELTQVIAGHVDPEVWRTCGERFLAERRAALGCQLVQDDDTFPRCPHCRELLPTISFRHVTSTLGLRSVYFCPRCQAVLGFSHRDGWPSE